MGVFSRDYDTYNRLDQRTNSLYFISIDTEFKEDIDMDKLMMSKFMVVRRADKGWKQR